MRDLESQFLSNPHPPPCCSGNPNLVFSPGLVQPLLSVLGSEPLGLPANPKSLKGKTRAQHAAHPQAGNSGLPTVTHREHSAVSSLWARSQRTNCWSWVHHSLTVRAEGWQLLSLGFSSVACKMEKMGKHLKVPFPENSPSCHPPQSMENQRECCELWGLW